MLASWKRSPFLFEREGIIGRFAPAQVSSLLLLFSFLFLFAYEPKLTKPILSLWWGKENILHYKNTVYGNITTSEKEGEYTLFYDGFPIFTIPNPDISFNEDLAHFSLLSHPAPKNCLLIGQGLGGLIREILKHPIERLDYLELDPEIIKTYKELKIPSTEEELKDKRVNLFYLDGRNFLKRGQTYDIIIINYSYPLTLNFNRLFTKEFYNECKSRLNPEGILVTISPSSFSYLSEELRDLVLSHYSTLKDVFPNIYTIFGDINIYLAGANEYLNLDTFAQRLSRRRLPTRLFSLKYLKIRLAPFYSQTFEKILAASSQYKEINQDLKPKGFLKSIIYLTALTSLKLPKIYKEIERIKFTTYLFLLLIAFSAILAIGILAKEKKRIFLPAIIFATGFWGMAVNIILIFIFQIRFGYLFNKITLLLTIFILGAAIGGFFSLLFLKNAERVPRIFLINEILILSFSLFLLIPTHLPIGGLKGEVLIFLFAFFTGLFLGLQFPLGNFLYLGKEKKIAETVGILFASDLLGGTTATFVASLFLIPSLGIIPLQYLVILIKFSSLILASLLIITGRQ